MNNKIKTLFYGKEKNIMEHKFTLDTLTEIFKDAIEFKAKFIATKIETPGLPKPQYVINMRESFENELKFYQNTYDYYLMHKFSPGIRILDCTYGNTISEIETQFAED